MEPTDRDALPPEVERRVAALAALAGPARAQAVEQLYRDFPQQAAALAARLAPDHSQVVTGGPARASLAERLRVLAERGPIARRYELHGEVARGGMGVILRAFDQDLGRSLAMKVVLGRSDAGGSESVDSQVLERFVEEAQITGQLDHPGVVPVHELGLDERGRAYFTMRLVRGRTAQQVFELARQRAEGWTPTRALEVLLKVCDTLAYAHSKSVVHRDLKPSNVMVGKYGEVYVMDWGLAKVLGQADPHDLRIRPPESTMVSRVRTDRSRESESDPDTALRTMDGAIVGTPCFMPPEQANGQVEEVGVRSDVYAAGAMLYTLLTGVQPYVRPGSKTSAYMILEQVRNGPPAPVHQLDAKAPVELVAICERAMARQPGERYATMGEFADDLRAYLEGRVVRAYRTGARAELAKWVRRNRGMAAGVAAALLAILGGGVWALVYAKQAQAARSEATEAKERAVKEQGLADAARLEAVATLKAVLAEQALREEAEADLRTEQRKSVELARDRWLDANARIALQSLTAFERYLEVSAVGGVVITKAQADAELGLLRASKGAEAQLELLDQTFRLINQEATILQELVSPPRARMSARYLEARHRMVAIARWRVGDWHAALQAHHLALGPGGTCNSDAETAWRRRNARELAHLTLGLREAGIVGEAVSAEVAGWLEATHDPWIRDLASFVEWRLRRIASGVAGSPESLGHVQRRLGLLAGAFATLAEDSDSATLQSAIRLERARCWLAVHEPHRALAALREGGGTFGCVFQPQLRQHAELRALSHAMAGELDAADAALAAAMAVTPANDTIDFDRLAVQRAAALRGSGRLEEAMAVAVARSGAPSTEGLAGLASTRRALVGDLAVQLGRRDIVTQLLRLEQAAPERGTAVLLALVRSIESALQAGDLVAAQRAGEQARRLVNDRLDALTRARSRCALAALNLAEGTAAGALRDLAETADACQQWVTAYARFRGQPMALADAQTIASISARAIDCLAHLVPSDEPLVIEAAWHVQEALRCPVTVAFGTRSSALTELTQHGSQYEDARARWLERTLAADEGRAAAIAADQDVATPSARLPRFERQLRAEAAPLLGALVPRVPSLAEVQARLPQRTGLVVFALGASRWTAVVVTAWSAELIAGDLPEELGRTVERAQLEALAAAVLKPVLRGRVLRETGRWDRLLLAPCGPLHALPFEWVRNDEGPHEPLLARVAVARVPSGSAWFDQVIGFDPAAKPRLPSIVLLGEAEPTGAERQWWTHAFAAFGRPDSVQVLAGDAATVSGLRENIADAACLGLSLPMAWTGAHGFVGLRTASAPDGSGVPVTGEISMQRLRDLPSSLRFAVLQATGEAVSAPHHAEAMASLVRGLWAGGCRTTITLTASQPLDPVAPLVAAVAAAAKNGEDPATAWTMAVRLALAKGTPPSDLDGLQVWTSK